VQNESTPGIELEKMKKPAPVWRGILSKMDITIYLPLKAVGRHG
jgi:hypothetical protein